jgi:hypothetical protein
MRDHEAVRKEFLAARGETAQVFALPTDGSQGLVFLEPGRAESLRARAKAGALICPIPDCSQPTFTTVGGTRRHHFRHATRVDGDRHAGLESVEHFVAKHLLARWLTARYGHEATISVERTLDMRRPDVSCDFDDGRTFAFEVQYTPITGTEWQERHDTYAARDIRDIWLFGHKGRICQTATLEGGDKQLRLAPPMTTLLDHDVPLLWFNPDTEHVATAEVPWDHRGGREGSRWRSYPFAVCALEDCAIEGGVFLTPRLRQQVEDDVRAVREATRIQQTQARHDAARVAALERAREAAARQEQANRPTPRPLSPGPTPFTGTAAKRDDPADLVRRAHGKAANRLPTRPPAYLTGAVHVAHAEVVIPPTMTLAQARELGAKLFLELPDEPPEWLADDGLTDWWASRCHRERAYRCWLHQ